MSRKNTFGTSALVAILCWIFSDMFTWLYGRFTGPESYYSHGFFIPVVSAWLIWQKRNVLSGIEKIAHMPGLLILVTGLFLQLISSIVEVYILSEVSLMVVLAGLILFLWGKETMKEVSFPYFFLLLMFPLPLTVINRISFPLKMLVTRISVGTLSRLGMPIANNGAEILLPNTKLFVGAPCSGLRSLIAFLAIAALFAYFLNGRTWKKILIFVSAVPIAVFSNYLRLIMLEVAAFIYGSEFAVDSFFHTLSGILVFVVGFILLFGLRRFCNEKV